MTSVVGGDSEWTPSGLGRCITVLVPLVEAQHMFWCLDDEAEVVVVFVTGSPCRVRSNPTLRAGWVVVDNKQESASAQLVTKREETAVTGQSLLAATGAELVDPLPTTTRGTGQPSS